MVHLHRDQFSKYKAKEKTSITKDIKYKRSNNICTMFHENSKADDVTTGTEIDLIGTKCHESTKIASDIKEKNLYGL